MYIEGEVPNVVTSNGNSNNNGGWGDWSWIVGLAIIGALFGGNGFGFGGGNRGGSYATQADLSAGFASNSVLSNLNDILLSQAQGFASVQQTLCQGFSGVNATVTNGFANLNTNLASLAYNTQSGFNGLGNQLAMCCCDIKTELLQNRYLNEKQTCEIVNASNANTRAILDYLTGEKISALQAENSGLKAQISNDRQTTNIISQLRDSNCPIPAYLRADPNCCFNPFTYYGVQPYGYNNCGNCTSVQ